MDASAAVKQDPYIKTEGDAVASPAVDEEDLYEDAGDLEFYDSNLPNDPYGTVYLAKVPKNLWDAWNSIDDDAEIQIGTVRTWNDTLPDGSSAPRLRMLLSSNVPQHQLVPKEYTLDLITTDSKNTFLFTEEDLPGFKAKSKARQEAAAAGIPMSLLNKHKPQAEKSEKPPERRGRYQPYYRKAIPKKTKISARIKYELQCRPMDNAETRHLERIRALEAMKPKHTLQIVGQSSTASIITHGSAQANERFGTFIKTTAPPKPTKGKKTEFKAARIPENELLDRIFECFRRYEYWGMKELKKELQQPEAYLRMVLEKVAELNKSGRFANKWSLMAGHRAVAPGEDGPVAEAAPDAGDVGDDDDEGDDEEVKMEDVF